MSTSSEIRAAFEYVAGVIRTASTMLQSADPVLGAQGWRPYANWGCVWPDEPPGEGLRSEAAERLPWYIVRQYHRPNRADKEVLSLVAVPYDPWAPGLTEAACVVSFMEVTTTEPEALYWLGGIQLYRRDAPLDGQVRDLDPRGIGWAIDDWEEADKRVVATVPAGSILTLARPLGEITDTAALKRLMIEPLLARVPAVQPVLPAV